MAYADVASEDVFHVALSIKPTSSDRRHVHMRGTVKNGSVAFETSTELARAIENESGLDPDGPSVGIVPSGKVVVTSGWTGQDTGYTGNITIWNSTSNETGGSWPSTFGSQVNLQIVDDFCNSRMIVSTATGAFGLWEDGRDPAPKISGSRVSTETAGAR